MISRHIKPLARRAAGWLSQSSNHFNRQVQGKVLILMYHRVVSDHELARQFVQPGMYVHRDVFDSHIRFLKSRFDILPFAELLDRWRQGAWNRTRRYCVITFDDGWLDNYLYAYPVLRTHAVPATIFLSTGFIGTNHWFWPDELGYLLRHYYAGAGPGDGQRVRSASRRRRSGNGAQDASTLIERIDSAIEGQKAAPEADIRRFTAELSAALEVGLPDWRLLLNWDEIHEMSGHGISFGSHACSHRVLTTLSAEVVAQEVTDSLSALRDRALNYVPVFSYPNGDYTPAIADQVRAAGYQAAVTTRTGLEDCHPPDLFSLRRIGIHNDVARTPAALTFHISRLAQRGAFAW